MNDYLGKDQCQMIRDSTKGLDSILGLTGGEVTYTKRNQQVRKVFRKQKTELVSKES